MDGFETALIWLDYAAVAVFGATGALAAARRKHDIVTFGFFAAITGVGGGTLRDLLLGAPVVWVHQPAYLVACLLAAVAVWLFGAKRGRYRLLIWLDALGMAAYSVAGAAKAGALGAPPLTAVVLGVLTATFGGIVRDVLADEPSVLLKREIYVTAALVGAATYVGLGLLGVGAAVAGLAGFGAALALRAGALVFGWSLPGFPGRASPED
ncbi:trimeric intracellular cation channel family protein [Phenylobacterium sp.]|uniref:trimeric intracellular cation channel family protein n=1 Tax=Phenylobacterium sp. TaxID=1871053 RepID=UPI00273520FA|nr:trimeric intracellular cation channel family protein [Phenylobacterium sp.]MDP3659289.1 trimeric intracellular cation channel family protein [Phenylobacterium sp.]